MPSYIDLPSLARGFTLLEGLVTVVVVSIGLLGILGLQTVSIVNTQLSSARSQATIAADNIADRMRANLEGVAVNAYDNVDHPAAGSKPTACESSTTCSPTEMATYDAWAWDTALGEQLPNGKGQLECVNQDGGRCQRYHVRITWNERDITEDGEGAGTVPITFETTVRP